MTLDEFLSCAAVELPKRRKESSPFGSFLETCFAEYHEVLDLLDGVDGICANVKKSRSVVNVLSKRLIDAVNVYLRGFPHEAYEHVRAAMNAVGPAVDPLKLLVGPNAGMQEYERIYRVRIGRLDKFERRDLFHVPFELRHWVSTQRYSISGLPSLYLGGSLWVCWEEMQKPDFHTLQVSRFRYSKAASVLDFGFRPKVVSQLGQGTLFKADWLTSYVLCWPLLAACSVRVLHTGMPFIPEYIVPQLLLQWLRNESGLDGLRYFSTKVEQYSHSPWAAMNYVFPVQEQATAGFCPRLSEKFHLTAPVPWSLLEKVDVPRMGREVEHWSIAISSDYSVPYYETEFFRCEHKVDSLPCEAI